MMEVIRFVGQKACKARSYRSGLKKAGKAIVDTVSADRNVTLQFRYDGKLVQVPMKGDVRDLIDLAMSVYIADELEKRESADDGWTRSLSFLMPVRDPARWKKAASELERTLSFLSQDRFTFEFQRRQRLPKGTKHRTELPSGFDTVCLFSGGIDSLLGASQLLAAGKKVFLVGHQAEPVTAGTQKALADVLRRKYPGSVALVQCRVARSMNDKPAFPLPDKLEETHRPRSFLFLALAVAVANATKIKEIFIPENGLIALNPPLQISRVGSHSTRTAHPVYLTRYAAFLKKAKLFSGSIRNPFLYDSKTDMLRSLTPWLIPLVTRSVSCSHPSRYHDEGVRHCGYCVPCIYRRAAMMVCGLDRHQDYAFDVFGSRRSLRKKKPLTLYAQADIRALVPFAQRTVGATDIELTSLVLAHGYFPPDVGRTIGTESTIDYSRWTTMLRRWATEFLHEIKPRCSRDRKKTYGLNSSVKVR